MLGETGKGKLMLTSAIRLLQSKTMHCNLFVPFVLAGTLIWVSLALADPLTDIGRTVYGNAPIGHLQPRRPLFAPNDLSEHAEQERESEFDAKERKLDRQFDQKLDICRC